MKDSIRHHIYQEIKYGELLESDMSKLVTNSKQSSAGNFNVHQRNPVTRDTGGVRKDQSRNNPRMNDFLLRIMTGRIFKQLMALALGRPLEEENPLPNDVEAGIIRDNRASQDFLSQSTAGDELPNQPDSFSLQNHRPRVISHHGSDTNMESTGQQTSTNVPSFEQDLEDMNMETLGDPLEPPLTSRYLQVFTYSGEQGETGSAMSLTRTLIWQLNTVFRCENKIARLLVKLKTLEEQQSNLNSMLDEIHRQLDQIMNDEDATEQLQSLKFANDLSAELEEQRIDLLQTLQQTEKELHLPKTHMYRDLKEVMSRNNLLEDISGESDSGHVPWNQTTSQQEQEQGTIQEQHTATSSEAARYAEEDAQEKVRELKTRKEIRLQDARQQVNNWANHYDEEYKEYCALVEEGALDVSRTEFDVVLFDQQRVATRELIEAEQEYEAAVQQARDLGVVFMDPDQESHFPDNADDGYRISMEVEMVEHVDRNRIEKWMAQEEDHPHQSTECDDWDSKTVDLCDSVSVVADGKEKARIKRWQAVCEERRLEVLTVQEDFDSEDHS